MLAIQLFSVLLSLPLPSQDLAPVLGDAERLLSPTPLAVLRIDSVDGVLGAIERIQRMTGDESPALDAPTALNMLPVLGAVDSLDTGRPAFAAIDLIGGFEPTLVWVLPSTDPAAMVTALREGGVFAHAAGGWVGLSDSPSYEAPGSPAGQLANLPTGTLSARLDIARAMQLFGPIAQAGIDGVEEKLLSDLPDNPAMDSLVDLEGAIELEFELVRAFLESVESFDFVLDASGDRLTALSDLTLRAGSPLDLFPLEEIETDLSRHAGLLDPNQPIGFLFDADWAAMQTALAPFTEDFLAIYAEPVRTAVRDYYELYYSSLALVDGPVVTTGGFGANGMNITSYAAVSDPEALLARAVEVLGKANFAELGMTLSGVERFELAGSPGLRWELALDQDRLLTLFEPEELSGADLAGAQTFLTTFLGGDRLYATAVAHGGFVVTTFGARKGSIETAVARLGESRTGPADLALVLEHLAGARPAFGYRYDMGVLFAQLAELIATLEEDVAFPDISFPLDSWFGIRGTHWSGGSSVRLQDLAAFIQAMEELERLEAAEAEMDPDGEF